MPVRQEDRHCRKIMRHGICRLSGSQFGIRKQDSGGTIERGIGIIEPGTAGIIRTRRHVSVIVITGFNMGNRRLVLPHYLTTEPEGEHQ